MTHNVGKTYAFDSYPPSNIVLEGADYIPLTAERCLNSQLELISTEVYTYAKKSCQNYNATDVFDSSTKKKMLDHLIAGLVDLFIKSDIYFDKGRKNLHGKLGSPRTGPRRAKQDCERSER